MLQATQLRKGTIFEHQGRVYRVVEYRHSHISRRSADIKVKVKDLLKGAVLYFNFSSSERFKQAEINRKKMQFLYREGDDYFFMDPVSFEQINLSNKTLAEKSGYLKEGEAVAVVFWGEQAIDVEIPNVLVYVVKQTAPNERGDSAVSSYKPAVLENGLPVKVPIFIKIGDRIKVDTRSGQYLARAK